MELYELLEGCTGGENRDLRSKSDLSALLSALTPFAEHAIALNRCSQARHLPDSCPMRGPAAPVGERPTIGDCRRAADLLFGTGWRTDSR